MLYLVAFFLGGSLGLAGMAILAYRKYRALNEAYWELYERFKKRGEIITEMKNA